MGPRAADKVERRGGSWLSYEARSAPSNRKHVKPGRGRVTEATADAGEGRQAAVRCGERSFCISNMVARSFPNTARSLSSATMVRLSAGS